jgi:hypothetical protein
MGTVLPPFVPLDPSYRASPARKLALTDGAAPAAWRRIWPSATAVGPRSPTLSGVLASGPLNR